MASSESICATRGEGAMEDRLRKTGDMDICCYMCPSLIQRVSFHSHKDEGHRVENNYLQVQP